MRNTPRHLIRYTFVKFLCLIGFLWLLILLSMSTWHSSFLSFVNQNIPKTQNEKMIPARLVNVIEKDLNKIEAEDDDETYDSTRKKTYKRNEKVHESLFIGKDDTEVNQESEMIPKSSGNYVLLNLKPSSSKHSIPKPILSSEKLELHRRLNLTNPGHLGAGVILPVNLEPDIEKMRNQSFEKYQINEFVSSLVPIDRELPDIRTAYCREKKYSEKLPMASIVMVFHNEALSMILRTMYSILNRTPAHLLREIILVDDCSDIENLKKPLKNYVASLPKVKIIHSPTRIGLIKARMMGAVNSLGPALVFMDAHIEVTQGWLEPLLDRLAFNKKITAIAVVDTIDMETLEYRYESDPKYIAVTGFDWNLMFNWKRIPDFEVERRADPNEPVRSPTSR